MIIDKHFKDWESATFGFGYGTGEEYTIPALKNFFNLLKEERSYSYEDVEKKFGKLGGWLMINILCHADILEYGTSPRFGWITEKGELLRDYLKTKTPDELYEMTTNIDDSYA